MQVAQRVFAGLLVALFVAGCGGGGGGGGSSPPPAANRPPQTLAITLSGARNTPGSPITMTAAATDPQNSPITYSWSFGDGATATGASVTHAYATEGTFTVRVTATNQLNLSASADIGIPIAYLPMVTPSIFAANEGHFLGQAFTAQSAIVEPNGLPLTYKWDFGDGTTSDKPNAVHTYAATGTYNVTFTGTNSANRSVSATLVVNVRPRSTLPARTDNAFSVFCSGAFCGAAAADTYSGQGVGVWRYHATGSAASISIAINGVSGGQTASLVFTNGQAVNTATAPSVGTLMSSVIAPTSQAKASRESSSADKASAYAHTQMLESNAASAREYLSKRPSRARVVSGNQKAVAAAAAPPPAVGTQRTWNDVFGGITPYQMQVAATCALPSGRNAVFWIDSAQVAAGKISPARVQYLADGFCGPSGAYATLTSMVGDVWGPDAAGSGYIEDAPGALQDLHIVMPGVEGVKWGGYFSVGNLSPKSSSPDSNAALAVFVNPTNLIANPDADGGTGSTLIHELKHHINFYQRTIVRARMHGTWLEETSAMLAEDFLTPAVFNVSRTWSRHQGYLGGGGGVGYLGWTHPDGGSYNFGGTFAGFLHRWYGLDIDRKLITDCDDHSSEESYQCMDALIVQLGGISFPDELERMGATVLGGMGRGGMPDGFGLPSIIREGFVLDSLESSSARKPELAMFAPLSSGNLATSHVYHLDVIAAGQTVYRRDNVEIPAGATLIVVVQ